jgi:hypothetical protein
MAGYTQNMKVYTIVVDYRRGGSEILSTHSTKEKAVEAILEIRDWTEAEKLGYCDISNGFWGDEDTSYQITEQEVL